MSGTLFALRLRPVAPQLWGVVLVCNTTSVMSFLHRLPRVGRSTSSALLVGGTSLMNPHTGSILIHILYIYIYNCTLILMYIHVYLY